jgi:hypothetical protein
LIVKTDPPEADIFIDGKAKGMSPLKLVLPQGAHVLEAKYPKYVTARSKIEIKDGQVTKQKLSLSKDPIMEVNCTPNGTIYVNDVIVGQSPQVIVRRSGKYKVRCENGGLSDVKGVDLRDGRVTVNLFLPIGKLKDQVTLRASKLKRAKYIGTIALVFAGLSGITWLMYESKLNDRDDALSDLSGQAWTFDEEAQEINDVFSYLAITTGLLGTWSAYEYWSSPPETNLGGIKLKKRARINTTKNKWVWGINQVKASF